MTNALATSDINVNDITSRKMFWDLTDAAKLEAEYDADDKLSYLETASVDVLINIFHEYRFFIKYFISDLGILMFKAPFGEFKCMIAEIAVDELGETPDQTHLKLWDDFLVSLGDDPETLEQSRHPENIELLEELRRLMLDESFFYGVGLRGMGAECLCQVYLSSAYKRLLKNPNIEALKDKIDWVFWDIHTGEEDIEHGVLVRNAIDGMLADDEDGLKPLAEGYFRAKNNWEEFWGNLYDHYNLQNKKEEVVA